MKFMDNFTIISRKNNGIGNNAEKYNTNNNIPVNNNGIFGNIGIPKTIVCI
jgi:hypothetical protein